MCRLLCALQLLLAVPAASALPVTNVAHLADLIYRHPTNGVSFSIDCSVSYGAWDNVAIAIADDSGTAIVRTKEYGNLSFRPGDRIHITGQTFRNPNGHHEAVCQKIIRAGHGPQPVPTTVTPAEILSGRHDGRRIRLSGVIRDALHDDTDPGFEFLVLSSQDKIVYAYFPFRGGDDGRDRRLIGLTVTLDGVCNPWTGWSRYYSGRQIALSGLDDVHVVDSPTSDPYNVPDITDLCLLQPQEITVKGRHKASGRTLCTWNGDTFLLHDASGNLIRVRILSGPLPKIDEHVEAVGFPTADIHHLNLTKAIWRTSACPPCKTNSLDFATFAETFSDQFGRTCVNSASQGKVLRLTGTVVKADTTADGHCQFLVKAGNQLITVYSDRSDNDAPREGCEIDVTGVCVLIAESWNADQTFPRINGVAVVTRDASDIVILKRPSWWSPAKFWTVIGTLFALLIAVVVWNTLLRRIAERRGQEISEQRLARAESDIKTLERTRLAVELHDSISQSLTSVAMEIMAAGQYPKGADPEMIRHLGIASRVLDSCRQEIRDCLWDLRNQALEDNVLDSAIRRTLLPHVRKTHIAIRFNVPRERLTDSTTHDILRIIRELVVNGINHGKATEIKIAGTLDDTTLLFSVSDNGHGFDIHAVPGVEQGHFGLEGIRERIRTLGGTVEIVSSPAGTKATVSVPTTCTEDQFHDASTL